MEGAFVFQRHPDVLLIDNKIMFSMARLSFFSHTYDNHWNSLTYSSHIDISTTGFQ